MQATLTSIVWCVSMSCRAVVTDHGSFVLFNIYVPNAGDRPERARLPAKLSFLSALKQQVDELLGAGRQVGGCACVARGTLAVGEVQGHSPDK